MSRARFVIVLSSFALTLPLMSAFGCGHSTTPPGATPSASPAAPTDTSPPASVPAAATTSSATAAATPATSGDVALPPGSAKPWNNAQSDGNAATTDRNISDYQAIVQSNRDKFRTCYDASLAAHPGIKGQVTLKFVLKPDGSVKEGGIEKSSSEITEEDLERCMMNALKTLKFPKSTRGMESTIRYPFNFKPGSKK
ncbi:MAG: TonB family protein [Deltaproteobacteria bacterium]|nr:TonB family protein [Deltaproteobacteria bacterium]